MAKETLDGKKRLVCRNIGLILRMDWSSAMCGVCWYTTENLVFVEIGKIRPKRFKYLSMEKNGHD